METRRWSCSPCSGEMKALPWGGGTARRDPHHGGQGSTKGVAECPPRAVTASRSPALHPAAQRSECSTSAAAGDAAPAVLCLAGTWDRRTASAGPAGGGTLLGWGSTLCLQTEGTPCPGGHHQLGAGTLSYAGEHGAGPAVGK